MMKLGSEILALLLILLLALPAVSGCSGNQGGQEPTGNPSTPTAGQTTAAADDQATPGADESGAAKEGFPIVQEKITLTAMAPQAPNFIAFGDMDTFKEYETMTNVHIEWNMVPSNAVQEKRNLALASGDLPDFFFGMALTQNDQITYGGQGVLVPLDGALLDNYAPNLNLLFSQYSNLKNQIFAADGHIYALTELNERPRDLWWGRLWVNRLWLNAVGLPMPKTAEDLYGILQAFKTKDPNGNGAADEVPLGSLLDMGSWGLSNIRSAWIDVSGGKLRFVAIDPAYKAYLQYHNKVYTEGLLDQEVFSRDAAQWTAEAQQGIIGVDLWAAPEPYTGTSWAANYDLVVPPIQGLDGVPPIVSAEAQQGTPIAWRGDGAFCMTNTDPYPEATMRWVDWLYSVDGDKLFLCGIEGKQYKVNSDGTWSLIIPEGKSRVEFMGQYTFTQGGGPFPRLFTGGEWGLKEYAPAGSVTAVANGAADTMAAYIPGEILPRLSFTLDEQKRLNTLQTDISTYITQMQASFVTGNESFDNWDGYVGEIQKMGLEELMNLYKAAYDRYNEAQ